MQIKLFSLYFLYLEKINFALWRVKNWKIPFLLLSAICVLGEYQVFDMIHWSLKNLTKSTASNFETQSSNLFCWHIFSTVGFDSDYLKPQPFCIYTNFLIQFNLANGGENITLANISNCNLLLYHEKRISLNCGTLAVHV